MASHVCWVLPPYPQNGTVEVYSLFLNVKNCTNNIPCKVGGLKPKYKYKAFKLSTFFNSLYPSCSLEHSLL